MQGKGSDASPRRSLLIVLTAFVVVQLPFLQTAFRVDDTNILAIARQIARAPLDPYGFMFNWTGTPRPAFDILANPPFVPALLAGWAGVFGWGEVALHALTLLFALGALGAMAAIASREGIHPTLAAAMLAASPAFFLAAHVVMPDMAMLALLLGAVAFAVSERPFPAALCGTFVALAKYNGIVAIPILAFIAWQRRSKLLALVAATPLLGLAVWNLFSLAQYGRMHLLVVSEERRQNVLHTLADLARRGQHVGLSDLALSILTITGLAVVPLGWQFLVRSSRSVWLITAVAGVLAAVVGRDLLLGVGVALGTHVLLEVLMAKRWLALAWIVAVLAFQGVTILIAVRYLLPLVAGALLVLPAAATRRAWAAVAISLLLAVGVAIGDAQHADCYRNVAKTLAGRRFYFAGHWGWQEYATRAGGVLIDVRNAPLLTRGDVVAVAPRTFPSPGRPVLPQGTSLRRVTVPCLATWPLQTTTCQGGASWYGDEIAGCPRFPIDLPFAFSWEPADEVQLFVVE